jgi:hypothetical protein
MTIFRTVNAETCNSKVEVIPVFNYAPSPEDIWKSGGIMPLILNLDTKFK